MKNWLSLLIAGSWPRATPRAPALKGRLLYSEGMLPPPVPLPAGSPPWITQSSTLWKVSPSKYLAFAFFSKLAIVLVTLASGSVWSLATMRPLAVSMIMYLPWPLAPPVAPVAPVELATVGDTADEAAAGVSVGWAGAACAGVSVLLLKAAVTGVS